MSVSKLIGTVAGAALGAAITTLIVIAALDQTSAPSTVVAAVILIGTFLGAALGSFIGKDDRLKLAVTIEGNHDVFPTIPTRPGSTTDR